MPTGFPGVPDAVGDVWKADWYIPHCYKIPALAQLNHLLAQIPRAPTRNDVWHTGTTHTDLRRFHRDLGEVVSEAELAHKQLAIFLQALQTTAAALQKEIGKRLSSESPSNPSVFRKWLQKFPGSEESVLSGAAAAAAVSAQDAEHSRSNSNSSGGGGNAAGGKLADGSNGSSPAEKINSESPDDESAPSLQPSKLALANRMRSKSMNVASSASLFRSPDDSGLAKPLGSEISPIFASAGLEASSGAGSGGDSAARKKFTRARSVRERSSPISGTDVERALIAAAAGVTNGGNGGGGGLLDACGFSPVLLRARGAGRVGPMGEQEGEGATDGSTTPALGRGGGNGGAVFWAGSPGIGGDISPGAAPINTVQQGMQGPVISSPPLQAAQHPSSDRHSGPLPQGSLGSSVSHADVAGKGPIAGQHSAKSSGSSRVGFGGFLFKSRSSRSSSHQGTHSQQQQGRDQVGEEEGDEEEQGEEEMGPGGLDALGEHERWGSPDDLTPAGRSQAGASGAGSGGLGSRRTGGPRLTKSRSEKMPSSMGGGVRGGSRAGKSGHERLQEILSSVSSGWGGLPLSPSLSGSSTSSGRSSLRAGSVVSKSATVTGTVPSMARSASVSTSVSMGGSVSGSGMVSPLGTAGSSSPFSRQFPQNQAHRLAVVSHSYSSSSASEPPDATPPRGGSDAGGVLGESGREEAEDGQQQQQQQQGGAQQGSRVLLSPAKAAQEELLLELLRSTPPIRWDKPGQRTSSDQPGT